MNNKIKKKGNPIALIPLVAFIVLYLGISILLNDFYALPITVPFLISAIIAIVINKKESVSKKIDVFCKGAGNPNIILMCVIFILAGAFAEVAKGMGAVDSTVNFGLKILPGNILVAGIFVIGCFISLSIGTSVGTIVALTPMAIGIGEKTGIPVALVIGAVIGGAMFGDNLSMISDTTIAATRTQGCNLGDKFRMNFKIVIPAAIITAIIFGVITAGKSMPLTGNYNYNFIKILPYISVLVAAVLGCNVLSVLVGGTLFSGIIGIIYGDFNFVGFLQAAAKGIAGMSELIIISIIIGGTVEVIKFNGGIDFLLNFITSKVKSKKGAELSIGILITLVDFCTANNTVAMVIAGPLAKDISEEYNIDPKRSASLLDTFSCFAQGILPYGAQLLVAAQFAKISPFSIMKYLYYPYLMIIATLIAIALGLPKCNAKEEVRLQSN